MADIFIACCAVIIAGVLMHTLSQRPPNWLRSQAADAWFDADIIRVCNTMTDWQSWWHYRTSVHPISSLITFVPVYILRLVFRLDVHQAINVAIGLYASLWSALLFGALRLTGLPRPESALLTAIGISSSTALLIYSIPETYVLSSASVLFACILAFLPGRLCTSEPIITLASAASLSVTVTNWIFGLVIAFMRLRRARAIQATVNAFFIVTVLWSLQAMIVKNTKFFTAPVGERGFLYKPTPARIAALLQTVFLSSVVAGGIERPATLDGVIQVGSKEYPVGVAMRGLISKKADYLAWTAIMVWLVVIIISGAQLVVGQWRTPTFVMLAVPLAGNIAIHLTYGAQIFLYSANWIPYLFLLIALGLKNVRSRHSLPLLFCALVVISAHNVRTYEIAINLLSQKSERDKTAQVLKNDPAVPFRSCLACAVWIGR